MWADNSESWHQIIFRESVDKISPNLDGIRLDIQRSAGLLGGRASTVTESQTDADSQNQVAILSNLRRRLRSAASIISSASTIMEVNHPDVVRAGYGSDFEDCFSIELN